MHLWLCLEKRYVCRIDSAQALPPVFPAALAPRALAVYALVRQLSCVVRVEPFSAYAFLQALVTHTKARAAFACFHLGAYKTNPGRACCSSRGEPTRMIYNQALPLPARLADEVFAALLRLHAGNTWSRFPHPAQVTRRSDSRVSRAFRNGLVPFERVFLSRFLSPPDSLHV